MRFGSLFTGIGGLDLGLERAGMQCSWQVEIDTYARRVLEKHWPDVPRFGDIKEVKHPPKVDLIAGGFPCQDISVAGKGAGLAGARSGLWREYARVVGEVRPAWVLIENVPALRTRGLATVLSDLHALGYDAEWDGISAASLGAHHRRDRLFIVAYSNCERVRLERKPGEAAAPIFKPAGFKGATPKSPAWPATPDLRGVVHGLPHRLDRIRGLGNAVVPQVAEFVGRLIMQAAGRAP